MQELSKTEIYQDRIKQSEIPRNKNFWFIKFAIAHYCVLFKSTSLDPICSKVIERLRKSLKNPTF